jgi:hypothetical protein
MGAKKARAANTAVERLYRMEERGEDLPPHLHPATTPPRCDVSEFFWQAVL